MTGIDRITAKLDSEALAEADAIRAEAAAQSEEIKKEYEKKAQAAYWNRIQTGTKECESRVQRLSGAADMESRKAVLTLKQEMLGQAFDRAAAQLCALPRDKYVAFLASQAAAAARSGEETLIFNAKDRAGIGEAVAAAANAALAAAGKKAALKVGDETRDIPGGLIVKQGDIEANCAVDTLVALRKNELSAQVAEILFA